MWDLSSLTRDQTLVSCVGRRILNHCATSEILGIVSKTNCGWICSSKLTDNIETSQMPKMTKQQQQPEPKIFGTMNAYLCLPLEWKLKLTLLKVELEGYLWENICEHIPSETLKVFWQHNSKCSYRAVILHLNCRVEGIPRFTSPNPTHVESSDHPLSNQEFLFLYQRGNMPLFNLVCYSCDK